MKMRAVALLACLLFISSVANAKTKHEAYYASRWCQAHRGQAEVVLPDKTRADCVTDTHAVEVDWARKWYEAVGQSLWYAFQTNKRAAVVLIVGPGEQKYVYRINSVIAHNTLAIDVYTIEK